MNPACKRLLPGHMVGCHEDQGASYQSPMGPPSLSDCLHRCPDPQPRRAGTMQAWRCCFAVLGQLPWQQASDRHRLRHRALQPKHTMAPNPTLKFNTTTTAGTQQASSGRPPPNTSNLSLGPAPAAAAAAPVAAGVRHVPAVPLRPGRREAERAAEP